MTCYLRARANGAVLRFDLVRCTNVFSFCGMCSLTIECVLFLQNVFSFCRICSIWFAGCPTPCLCVFPVLFWTCVPYMSVWHTTHTQHNTHTHTHTHTYTHIGVRLAQMATLLGQCKQLGPLLCSQSVTGALSASYVCCIRIHTGTYIST